MRFALGLEDGGNLESWYWKRNPIHLGEGGIDRTWELVPPMKMKWEDRPGSTCLTSNTMVLGQRLPSISSLPHATVIGGWYFWS